MRKRWKPPTCSTYGVLVLTIVRSRPHHLSNLSKFGEGLTVFFLFSCWFSSFFLSHFLEPSSLPSRQLSNLLSRSQFSFTCSQCTLYWFGLGFRQEGGREEQHAAGHAAIADNFWEEEGSPSLSLLAFILPIK